MHKNSHASDIRTKLQPDARLTARKPTLAELQAKIDWYEDIIDAVPFPIHVLD